MSALFSTFGIDWHLLIAQTVNFVVLLAILSWLLYKPVLKMVDERKRLVVKGVEDAEEAERKLAEADGEAAIRVGSAEKEAEEIVKGARALGAAEKATLLKEAEARAAQVERDAAARAAEDLARAKRESEKDIARLAVLAAEKVLRK
jgi:F-type H+-transporting ATPase subunit b